MPNGSRLIRPIATNIRHIRKFSEFYETPVTIGVGRKELTQNSQNLRQYLDHPAQANSVILGASNPILPCHKLIADAAAAALYDARDIYTELREPHQENSNTQRYYSSRSSIGIPPLRKALSQYCANKGFKVDALDFYFTNSILTTLIPEAYRALCKENDSVLITTPLYGAFYNLLNKRKFDVGITNLGPETGWKLTPEILETMLKTTPDAKTLLFTNPGNPLGEVYSADEVTELAKVVIKHNSTRPKDDKLVVISDEVARNVSLTNKAFASIGAVPGMEDFTYTCWSLAKDQGPGLGVAVGIGPKWLINKTRLEDNGPPYALQVGATEAFKMENQEEILAHYERANEFYRSNLKLVTNMLEETNFKLNESLKLKEFKHLIFPEFFPEGGFQFVFNASGLLGLKFPESYEHKPDPSRRLVTSSLDLAWYLREDAKVELIAGEGFGFAATDMRFRMTLGKLPQTYTKAIGGAVTDSLLKLTLDHTLHKDDVPLMPPPPASYLR